MKIQSRCCLVLAATATVLSLSTGFTIQTANPKRHQLQWKTTTSTSTTLQALSPILINGIASESSTTDSNASDLRRPIVAGNWKLNPSTAAEAVDLLNGLKSEAKTGDVDVVIFPPLPYLSEALSILEGTGIQVGAQTASSFEKGAYTGEIAPSMLASTGCSHVLLGHSERRTLFGESDASINDRMKACLDQPDLKVVLCVGETLGEYEAGLLSSVVDTQLRKGLAGVSAEDLLDGRIIVAYEPVWAIGTGLVATPDQAQAAHLCIRETLKSMYADQPDVASSMRIQYGGSVSPESVADLMAMPDVDGALVGGASLTADSFSKIVDGAAPATAPTSPSASSTSTDSADSAFTHAPLSYFDLDNLTSKGPRKNADVGQPHDSTRPLTKVGSMSTGAWWCAAGGWPSPALRPTTEVFYVLEGNGCLTDLDGTQNFFGPGDLVILPKEWSGRWDVLKDIHKVWAVTDHPDLEGSTKAVIKQYHTFAPQNLTPVDIGAIVTHGSPQAAFGKCFDNGVVTVGCWTCTPGSFTIPAGQQEDEMIHMLEGVMYINNADGSARRCEAGDTIVLPKGWTGQFDIVESVKQIGISSK